MRSTVLAVVFGLGCLSAAGLGCGSGQAPSTKTGVELLPQGLTLFSSSEAGISGAYKSGTKAVYFDTLRGQPTVPGYKELMPNDVGDYEMDARLMDPNGNLLMLQRGGDTWVDPTWGDQMAQQNAAKTKVVAVDPDVLQLSQEISAAVTAKLPAATDHVRALSGLSGASVQRAETIRTQMAQAASGLSTQGTTWCGWDNANGQNASDDSCNWTWSGTSSYKVHYACIVSVIWCVGDHSAVEVDGNGFILYSCNHGGCAYTMGSVSCTGSGSSGDTQIEGTGSLTQETGACTTSYNWNSGGGTHNCHDDSMMEGYSVIYGWQSTTAGVCQGLNWWMAPGESGHACP
jgi:hypothetical protein